MDSEHYQQLHQMNMVFDNKYSSSDHCTTFLTAINSDQNRAGDFNLRGRIQRPSSRIASIESISSIGIDRHRPSTTIITLSNIQPISIDINILLSTLCAHRFETCCRPSFLEDALFWTQSPITRFCQYHIGVVRSIICNHKCRSVYPIAVGTLHPRHKKIYGQW